jgi:hypothetical protein
MNDAVHQLLQLILQGITWVLRTIESLWIWSWSQIAAVFNMPWEELPGWKLAIGLVALITLAVILVIMFRTAVQAFGKIATAFWTMAVTTFGIMTFVLVGGLFSRGFQWVVASVPDNFWEKILGT